MSRWAAVLCGGTGTRFWPLSTRSRPKQLLALAGTDPLLRQTVDRLAGLVPPERVLIVTGRDLLAATRAVLPDVPEANFLAEPPAGATGTGGEPATGPPPGGSPPGGSQNAAGYAARRPAGVLQKEIRRGFYRKNRRIQTR